VYRIHPLCRGVSRPVTTQRHVSLYALVSLISTLGFVRAGTAPAVPLLYGWRYGDMYGATALCRSATRTVAWHAVG
jgi:nitroimidazol reductase NimA-like FMN-containing flavoprotein (pyridoxamine 5'-phosphate oxidase superfamily)